MTPIKYWFSNKCKFEGGETVKPLHRMALLVQIPSIGGLSIGFEPALGIDHGMLLHTSSIGWVDEKKQGLEIPAELRERVQYLASKYCSERRIKFKVL